MVPVKNIANAFHPRPKTALRSILKVININAAGRRNLLATKYKLECSVIVCPELLMISHSGAIIPNDVKIAGMRYAIKRPGTIL